MKKYNLKILLFNFFITIIIGLFSTAIFVLSYEYWYYHIKDNHLMGYEYEGGLAAIAAPSLFIFIFLSSSLLTLILLYSANKLKTKLILNSKLHYQIYSYLTSFFGLFLIYPNFDFEVIISIFTPLFLYYLYLLFEKIKKFSRF
jgi:hypothetical protein